MTYFNTTQERGKDLKEFKHKATCQTAKVLGVFKGLNRPLGASEIPRYYFGEILLTSVRRSITVLCNEGFLQWTGEYKTGAHGRKERTWILT